MSDRAPSDTARRPDWAALAIAAGLVAIAAIVVWDMQRLPPPGRYDPLGPAGFPYLVAGGLVVLAVFTVIGAFRGGLPEREPQSFLPVIWMIGGLLVQMALLKPLGFTVATGLLFAAVAYGFGERRLYLSLPFGLVLSGGVWFVFARLLKLTLPEGPPEHFVVQMLTASSGAG